VRLLAETGLIGSVFFLLFLFSALANTLDLLRRDGFLRYLGIAGLFAWLAIALYNVTQDSFAAPNIWLIFGILNASSAILSKNASSAEDGGSSKVKETA